MPGSDGVNTGKFIAGLFLRIYSLFHALYPRSDLSFTAKVLTEQVNSKDFLRKN
jgi:hypothetical protein